MSVGGLVSRLDLRRWGSTLDPVIVFTIEYLCKDDVFGCVVGDVCVFRPFATSAATAWLSVNIIVGVVCMSGRITGISSASSIRHACWKVYCCIVFGCNTMAAIYGVASVAAKRRLMSFKSIKLVLRFLGITFCVLEVGSWQLN